MILQLLGFLGPPCVGASSWSELLLCRTASIVIHLEQWSQGLLCCTWKQGSKREYLRCLRKAKYGVSWVCACNCCVSIYKWIYIYICILYMYLCYRYVCSIYWLYSMKNLHMCGQNNWIKSTNIDSAFLHIVNLNCMQVIDSMKTCFLPLTKKHISYFCLLLLAMTDF